MTPHLSQTSIIILQDMQDTQIYFKTALSDSGNSI